jgi:hypothetical protein
MKVTQIWLVLIFVVGCSSSDNTPASTIEDDSFSVQQLDTASDISSQSDAGLQCAAPTPFFAEWLGQCCECLVGTHCSSGACNQDCTCAEPGQACSLCTGATPKCLEANGKFQECVACLTTEDCTDPAATCVSNTCTSPPPDPPEIDGIPVTCQAGQCWGVNGKCNGDTVVCKDGAECITLELLFNGEVPAGVIDPGGYCKCQPTPGALPGTEQGSCPEGLLCGSGPLNLLVKLLDGSISVPNHCFEDK